jgi:UDP-N-acetylmuramoylalanine--D-glutamate ligase
MSKYKGKKVLIVGFGLSGVATARYMCEQNAKVTVTDLKQKHELMDSVTACEGLKIEYELGKHDTQTFLNSELVIVSPGVSLSTKPLDEVRAANIPIMGEIDLAAACIKEPLIAVTGTNGKTTTTTLIGEMFKADNKAAFIGGNIGKPLIDYANEEAKVQVVVCELSSFQIELAQKVTPAVAVFTNIEPDHLDRYPDLNSYIDAKKRLLRACDRNTYVVLNHDDPIVSRFASETSGKVIWFTKRNPVNIGGEFAEKFVGCYLNSIKKQIVAKFSGQEEVYDVSMLKIFGEHNKENLMAAICTARLMGVSVAAIQKVINEFKGVPHRLEFVRKKDGVFFFNDSKGTNVMSVKRSLMSFATSPIILIAGGRDKNQEFEPLQELVKNKVKLLILVGEAKEKINRAIGDFTETYLVGTFEEAVLFAYQKSRTGDIILLSPGCSSFDMFRNFEERGEYFKKLVQQL